jgi:hypothetical protein
MTILSIKWDSLGISYVQNGELPLEVLSDGMFDLTNVIIWLFPVLL